MKLLLIRKRASHSEPKNIFYCFLNLPLQAGRTLRRGFEAVPSPWRVGTCFSTGLCHSLAHHSKIGFSSKDTKNVILQCGQIILNQD